MKKSVNSFNWLSKLENIETDSIDNDFILFKSPIVTTDMDYPFRIDVTIVVICLQGTVKGSINLKQYHENAPCVFILLPDHILQYEYFSDDFSGLFIVISKEFGDNLLINMQDRFPFFLAVHNNPHSSFSSEELETMIDYFTILQKIIRKKDNPHRIEIVKHFIQAFFYSSSYQFHKIPDKLYKTKQDLLVEKFLSCVHVNHNKERSLAFYADKLCLTPKYLSKVIKETSGSSANTWINNYVILEAKVLLKSSNLTIEEISEKLNFPSQSFFGKYFKRQVKLSPIEYRKS